MAEKKGIMDWEFDEIYKWCEEHNELAWLKQVGETMVDVKVYPRIKAPKMDANGEPERNKKGQIKYTTIADKTQEPKIVQRRITFVQIKTEFLKKFNLAPAPAKKKTTMYDILDSI